MYVLLFLGKASCESIVIDENNIMSKIHACTCTYQILRYNHQNFSTCMSLSNFMQVLTWHKDYNVMLKSEV